MGQASVLTDTEIRRVFRIIETTRHAERNRLAFVLSVYAGLRVGEIAALTIGDVATQSGEVRREIKLGAHQTKGSKGRTVVLSERVEKEIGSFLKTKPVPHDQTPLIASQRSARAFSNVTLSMLFKAIHEIAVILNFFTFRAANLCDTVECSGRKHEDHSATDGAQKYWHDCAILRREQRNDEECRGSHVSF